MTTFEPGQWVRYSYETRVYNDRLGYQTKTNHDYGRVKFLHIGSLTLESWGMAKITKRTKAFGQRIDKSPYRVGGTFTVETDRVTTIPDGMARQLEAKLQQTLRYPTYAERRRLRDKKRSAT